jgi:hypothetical protein
MRGKDQSGGCLRSVFTIGYENSAINFIVKNAVKFALDRVFSGEIGKNWT